MTGRVQRARFLSEFEMEPFIGRLLFVGMGLSLLLLIAGSLWARLAGGTDFSAHLEGTNVLQFLLADLQRLPALLLRPQLLVDAGIATLLVTPCIRVIASMWYFAVVERDRLYTALAGLVATLLIYILFFG